MKKGLTELVFILDRSGSMQGLELDTIGGFNSMLLKQKELVGECNITTVLFDNNIKTLHDRISIKAVGLLTEKEYQVGGSTSLLDAVGTAVDKIVNVQRGTAEDYQAEKVLFVIITDGAENSSSMYSSQNIKEKIHLQTEKYGWEFIFLGANIDAVETASEIGIQRNRAANFHADHEGVSLNFEVMAQAVCDMRESTLQENWADPIVKDFKKRATTR